MCFEQNVYVYVQYDIYLPYVRAELYCLRLYLFGYVFLYQVFRTNNHHSYRRHRGRAA